MIRSPEPKPILAAIAEACELARELISVLKREAESLMSDNAEPACFIEARDRFLAILAQVLDQARENSAVVLKEDDELCAFDALQTLIAEIKTAPLDSLIKAHPESVEYCYKRAGVLFSLGRDEEAQRDYLTVLAKQPAHFGALNDLGILLMETGKQTEARDYFSLAINAHPGQPIAYLNLADIFLAQADYNAAISHYQAALDIEPSLEKAHQGLSHALAGLGDQAGAARHRESGFPGKALISWPYRCWNTYTLDCSGSAFGGNSPSIIFLIRRFFKPPLS